MLTARLSFLSKNCTLIAPCITLTTQYANKSESRKYSTEQFLSALGSGGRASFSGYIATVFGSSGFIGRYLVNRLGRMGSQVVVPFRGEDTAWKHLKLCGDLGQIVPTKFDIRNPNSIEEVVARSNIVINLIGRNWDTRNFSMDEANHLSAKDIAAVCKRVGVEQFIHVSAAEASLNSQSEWAKSKARGEAAVRREFPNAVILRPTDVYGYEDRFLNKWAGLIRHWPFVPIVAPDRRCQPVKVSDLATAAMHVVENYDKFEGRTLNVAGPKVYTHKELMNMLKRILVLQKKPTVTVPLEIAKISAQVQGLLRSPRFTVDEITKFQYDSVVEENDINELGVERPAVLEDAAIEYIRHYRKPLFLNVTEY